MFWFFTLIFGLSLVLQVLLLNSLRKGAFREYVFIFAYSIVLFVTTLADGAVQLHAVILPIQSAKLLFYSNDAVRQFMLFTVVISLIDRALRDNPIRSRLRLLLISVGLAAIVVSFQLHPLSEGRIGPQIVQITRDLSFASVGLTLLLWFMLIALRRKDHQLLMITGGLGLQFTGEAIGQSLRQLSKEHMSALIVGNLVAAGTHLLRLYVWYSAFKKAPLKEKEPTGKPLEAFPPPAQSQKVAESNS